MLTFIIATGFNRYYRCENSFCLGNKGSILGSKSIEKAVMALSHQVHDVVSET